MEREQKREMGGVQVFRAAGFFLPTFSWEVSLMEYTHKIPEARTSLFNLSRRSLPPNCSMSDKRCLSLRRKLHFVFLRPEDSVKEKLAGWTVVRKEFIRGDDHRWGRRIIAEGRPGWGGWGERVSSSTN